MPTNPFDLRGKVAAVTGGNGGLGLGMAIGLARAGAAVLVVGRNEEKNRSALAQLADIPGARAHAMALDVTADTAGRALVDGAIERFGRLDILVNNAGANVRRQPQEYEPAEFRALLDVNLTSAFACARAAHGVMKVGGGKIVNVGSMMSLFGTPFTAAYAAAKGGIVQLTKSLATAWARDGIQVNAILPGWITTDFTLAAQQEIDGLRDRVLERTPAARWGTPADVAGLAVFLSSPAADFITGAAIPVDGGYSVQG